ncbi:MAG: enoyl-CoA hydratase/isomerase family protein, partial [Terriglobales bacterium]
MIADFGHILVEVQGMVGRIRLGHSPLNILTVPMMREMSAALEEMEARADVSVVVFEGDARAFSAGVDIGAHVPEQVRDMLASFHSVIRAVVASRKVTIAAVRGAC